VGILVIEKYIVRFHSDLRADSSCTQMESFVSSKHLIHVPVAWLSCSPCRGRRPSLPALTAAPAPRRGAAAGRSFCAACVRTSRDSFPQSSAQHSRFRSCMLSPLSAMPFGAPSTPPHDAGLSSLRFFLTLFKNYF
jgi:hypothetical protein